MNKGVKLLLAVVVLGVLIAAWFGVRGMSDTADEPEDTTTYLFVVRTDPAQLVSIEYDIKGEKVAFEYRDGTWINPAEPYMPLDQTQIATVASALTTVACNRLISAEGNNSAEYGLDAPSYSITMKYTDGSTVEYYIGLQNKHTSEYYLSVKGSAAVYSVNPAILDYCSNKYEDLLVLDEIEDIAASKVNKIVTESEKGTVTLEKLTRTVSAESEDGGTEEISETYYVLTNEAGSAVELDAETGDEIVDGVLTPIVLSCPDYHLEENERGTYGLASPTKLTVHYTEELEISTENSSAGKVQTPMKYEISFGFVQNGEEKAVAYMQLPDSDMVFSVDISAFESLF
ncbi:MAG: DUF4340 domain-containing protein [Clostridia bacterium]|nr:DUF4340 domain-containing protein [Clostridia bacterium]